MNTFQRTFEYEFLPVDYNDPFIQKLSSKAPVDMYEVISEIPAFIKRYEKYLDKKTEGYGVKEKASTSPLVLITMACLENRHYLTGRGGFAILTLGYWKRYMAPPSLIEFIFTLLVRLSVGFVCPALESSAHFGTRGCLFDVTSNLNEVRLKVLNGFVCHSCRTVLASEGFSELPNELSLILKKDWLGKASEPEKPAGVAAHLGYDLFTTKGPQPTDWETAKKTLQEEWVKQVLTILAVIVGAALLLWFGLK